MEGKQSRDYLPQSWLIKFCFNTPTCREIFRLFSLVNKAPQRALFIL